jgi:copper transport protein
MSEPLLSASDVILGYIHLTGTFIMLGAAGFRFGLASAEARTAPGAEITMRALDRAALFGLTGALMVLVGQLADSLTPVVSGAKTLGAVLTARQGTLIIVIVSLVVAALGYALARRRVGWGWYLGGLAAAYVTLRGAFPAFSGRWQTAVNPIHVFAGSMWIGTLFIMVAAVLPVMLDQGSPREQRGPAVARLVAAFSPIALTSAAVLGTTGVITAWRHLKYLSALWTTPYGYTLLVKLTLVVIVVVLGAWHWRRVRPRLGEEDAARQFHRSARAEVIVAGLVLLVTSVLISLPAPKAPAKAPVSSAAPQVTQ